MTVVATNHSLEVARLIAPEALHALLAPALRDAAAGAELGAVSARYLRLKPGRSALLGLELEWRTDAGATRTLASLYVGADAELAAAKARTRRLLEPAIGPAVLELPALPAVLVGFPNDRVLKGLSAAADARRLGNRLAGEGGAWASEGWRVRARHTTVESARWKPERRAVLRAELALRNDATCTDERETVWVRVHSATEHAAREAGWIAASRIAGLAVPHVRWSDPERGLIVTAHAEGKAFDPADPCAWQALGRSLAALHGTTAPAELPVLDEHAALAAAQRTLDSLAVLLPLQESRAAEIRAALARHARSLRATAPSLVHGDLTVDQVLSGGNGLVLLDWDEAAAGDAHADLASFAADLSERGLSSADCVSRALELAAASLGTRADAGRLHWQLAAAHARRALSGLQRGSAGWESQAEQALERAEQALQVLERSRPSPRVPYAGVTNTLRALLDPSMRAGVAGVEGRSLTLAAVWPADAGAIARLDDPAAPGVPALWLEIGEPGIAPYEFPEDPGLPELSAWIARGETAAGHRLGKRAALRTADGASFRYLRPARTARKAWDRVRSAHVMLDAAGVPHAAPSVTPGGWISRAVRGAAWPVRRPTESDWREAGSQLARVHRLGAADRCPDALAAVRASGETQIALVARVREEFAAGLAQDLAGAFDGAIGEGTPAWTHGDLHPGQLVCGEETLWIDWERARIGEAEGDLGNLAAHLAWEWPQGAREAWDPFVCGYREAGGLCSHDRFVVHAVATLARLRAIHSWRDAGCARATDTTRWQGWREEVSSW